MDWIWRASFTYPHHPLLLAKPQTKDKKKKYNQNFKTKRNLNFKFKP